MNIRIGKSDASMYCLRMFQIIFGLTLMMLSLPMGCIVAYKTSIIGDQLFPIEDQYYLDGDWILLSPPPSHDISLIAIQSGRLFIETPEHKIYSCLAVSRYDGSCWREESSIPAEELDECHDERFLSQWDGRPTTPPYIENKKSLFKLYCDLTWREPRFSRFKFVLTPEGKMWQWGLDDLHYFDTPKLDRFNAPNFRKQNLLLLFTFALTFILLELIAISLFFKGVLKIQSHKVRLESEGG